MEATHPAVLPVMTGDRPSRSSALVLIATGVVLFAGLALHPHDPNATSMAEVAYVQTGQARWWPAHALLLTSYVLFVVFLVQMSSLTGLPTSARRVLKVALPIASFGVLAMLVHLLLGFGHDSLANSHKSWAFWLKDVVETYDGVWAVSLAGVAWVLGRAGSLGNRLIGLLGLLGGIGFALFSFAIPLTGPIIPVTSMGPLVPKIAPAFGLLVVAWTITGGVLALRKAG